MLWFIKIMIRIYFISVILIGISGCSGISAIRIHGFAPTTKGCEVRLVKSRTDHVIFSKRVKGEFTKTLIWEDRSGDPTIVGVCNGVVTKELTEWRKPRMVSEPLELGDISP